MLRETLKDPFVFCFVATVILLLLIPIVSHGEEMIDRFMSYLRSRPQKPRRTNAERYYQKRRWRVRKWRLALPFITRQRQKRELRHSERQAEKKSINACAETLASFQDAFEVMGEEMPSVHQVTREVIKRQNTSTSRHIN